MGDNPLISVVIPAFNRVTYLERSIGSVLTQSYTNIELIIVDDGSTDATPKLTKQFQKTDGRVSVIRQENKGVSAARNRGILAAKGNFIAFLDSDDAWKEQKLEKQIALLGQTANKLTVCCCNFEFVNGTQDTTCITDFSALNVTERIVSGKGGIASGTTMLAPRPLFEPGQIGLFDETMHMAEEYDWLMRFIHKEGQFAYISESLACYTCNAHAYRDAVAALDKLMSDHTDWIKEHFGPETANSFQHEMLRRQKRQAQRAPLETCVRSDISAVSSAKPGSSLGGLAL